MATKGADFTIDLREVSKRFGRQWILRQFSATFITGSIYGIRGRNGSGKSTLLRMLAGQLSPTRGQVSHRMGKEKIKPEQIFSHVSWTGPYIEIMEELTVSEQLEFHYALKPVLNGFSTNDLLERIELSEHRNRKLSECSSGMRQRVLLATALYADTPVLLLDEPTLTLDEQAAKWFHHELEQFVAGRLCIIASNDSRDLSNCDGITIL